MPEKQFCAFCGKVIWKKHFELKLTLINPEQALGSKELELKKLKGCQTCYERFQIFDLVALVMRK
jgi:hypothetical protein